MKLKCINKSPLKQVLSGDVNDYAPNLKVDEIYELVQTCKDSQGNEHYDVGLKSTLNFVRSIETGEELPNGDKIHWCHPSRFEVVPDEEK